MIKQFGSLENREWALFSFITENVKKYGASVNFSK